MAVDFSRRNFIKGMSVVGVGAAASAALAACSPKAADSAKSDTSATAAQTGATWRTAPAKITDFAKEIDCDVVVCGHGFAGITACRELAEQGKKVAVAYTHLTLPTTSRE